MTKVCQYRSHKNPEEMFKNLKNQQVGGNITWELQRSRHFPARIDKSVVAWVGFTLTSSSISWKSNEKVNRWALTPAKLTSLSCISLAGGFFAYPYNLLKDIIMLSIHLMLLTLQQYCLAIGKSRTLTFSTSLFTAIARSRRCLGSTVFCSTNVVPCRTKTGVRASSPVDAGVQFGRMQSLHHVSEL